jgi:hypothetical protein
MSRRKKHITWKGKKYEWEGKGEVFRRENTTHISAKKVNLLFREVVNQITLISSGHKLNNYRMANFLVNISLNSKAMI